jgi:hypothetical protein
MNRKTKSRMISQNRKLVSAKRRIHRYNLIASMNLQEELGYSILSIKEKLSNSKHKNLALFQATI